MVISKTMMMTQAQGGNDDSNNFINSFVTHYTIFMLETGTNTDDKTNIINMFCFSFVSSCARVVVE